jgi:hypothetical protein
MKKSTRGALGLLIASGITPASEKGDLLPEARRVKSAYGAFAAQPSRVETQSAYLEAFPADYATFMAVFMADGFGQLSDGSYEYIQALDKIGRSLPEETFRKVLKIESLAHWDADGINFLQEVTLKLALARPKAFAAALEALRPAERRGVAGFLADGPHGPPEETLGLAAKLEVAGASAFASLLRQEAELSESRSHDH